ncbi:MAG TPA: TonB-dependent receptor plug domain-containing protein [Prolixibacteraceae bacterium]|nr:TonB-dependent receptor plug domain-containing protein [Prolixibacteraceae bacterium]
MRKILFILLFVPFSLASFSQPFQINGYVKDRSSGDLLPNAYLSVVSEGIVACANNYGYFSFAVRKLPVEIKVSFTGYEQLNLSFNLKKDTTITCLLVSNTILTEVEVRANDPRQVLKEEVGAVKLSGKELEKIPSLLGEHDLVKALQLMPGIKMGREGTSGMYVRGGTPGQNLILLDDVPVYNVNHLFGFFSVFTPEAVRSVDIYKGAFPARYSGRISSVMDLKMREGNLYHPIYDLTIGTLSSKVVAEIPVVKGKSSLLFSGRRTYFGLLMAPFWSYKSPDGKTTGLDGYYFYDLNAKYFVDLGGAGKLYWSCYTGRDDLHTRSVTKSNESFGGETFRKYKETTKYSFNWGNFTTSLRWNKTIGKKLFLNTTFLFSQYSFISDLRNRTDEKSSDTLTSQTHYQSLSKVRDYGVYADFDYFISSTNHMVFGAKITHHDFIPGSLAITYEDNEGANYSFNQGTNEKALEFNTYVEERLCLFKKWKINAGIHHSLYKVGDTHFSSIQPRIRSALEFDRWALKCSGGYMVQPIHNLVNNTYGLTVDIWVPSEANIRPATSLQFDVGADWFFNKIYTLSADGYWRKMNHILTYQKGETFFRMYEDWTHKVISGSGESYGIELMVRKTEGETTGWAGYTWSVSNQRFRLLNNGNPFPSPYDRRHYFTISVNHRFSEKVQLSGNWIFATGEPITVSTTAYDGDSFYGGNALEVEYMATITKKISSPNQIVYYQSLNQYRLPSYHRLDIGVDLQKKKNKGTRIWSFSVYNVYCRNNPVMVSIEEDENGDLVLKNANPFTFFPSVSYRFIFK